MGCVRDLGERVYPLGSAERGQDPTVNPLLLPRHRDILPLVHDRFVVKGAFEIPWKGSLWSLMTLCLLRRPFDFSDHQVCLLTIWS